MNTHRPLFPMPDLTGPQGNAFFLLGQAEDLLRREGFTQEQRDAFHADATAGDYDNLLATIRSWFRVATATTTWKLEDEEEED